MDEKALREALKLHRQVTGQAEEPSPAASPTPPTAPVLSLKFEKPGESEAHSVATLIDAASGLRFSMTFVQWLNFCVNIVTYLPNGAAPITKEPEVKIDLEVHRTDPLKLIKGLMNLKIAGMARERVENGLVPPRCEEGCEGGGESSQRKYLIHLSEVVDRYEDKDLTAGEVTTFLAGYMLDLADHKALGADSGYMDGDDPVVEVLSTILSEITGNIDKEEALADIEEIYEEANARLSEEDEEDD